MAPANGSTGAGTLPFTAINPVSRVVDQMTVPAGYDHGVILRWGDPLFADSPEFQIEAQTAAAQEIADSVEYGVVKMNVDTDTQYAFTRPVAGHMFENYDGVLKVDGEVGDKKQYDPRVWGAKAEEAMAARVVQACTELNSAGKSIG